MDGRGKGDLKGRPTSSTAILLIKLIFFKPCSVRRERSFVKNGGKKEKERAFLENGSMLLEILIVSCNGRPPPIRSFSIEELELATNNDPCHMFHRERLYENGSFEGRMVYIKKYKQDLSSVR